MKKSYNNDKSDIELSDTGYCNIPINRYLKEKYVPQNNLPIPLTEFIGRENEINNVLSIIKKARLVTLTGPGGIGKTRLAIEAATKLLDCYKDGVFFVSLASITQPELVTLEIARVLNIKELPGQSILDLLKSRLRDRVQLLILDNFEQVVGAALMVAELLKSAPKLTVMVTSREVLKIAGEYVFGVPPMEIPDLSGDTARQILKSQSAIALFLYHAKAVINDFELTDENASEIVELCTILDGIPLAIELAAANIRVFSICEMLNQSKKMLDWLNNGPRDLPIRQHTMRNTLKWSISLLSDSDRKMFTRLGVFSGKFNFRAVEAIIYNDCERAAAAQDLFSLINKSLLKSVFSYNQPGEQYYDMLEIIREYSLELLDRSGEEEKLRTWHAEFYLSLVVDAENNMNGPDRQMWLSYIENSHSNILSVFDWAQKISDIELEIKLAAALGHFWEVRGYWNLGVARLKVVIERYRDIQKSEYLAKVYQWYGRLTNLLGDQENAEKILREGLALASKIGDYRDQASILYNLGWVKNMSGYPKEQENYWNQSLSLYRKINDKPGIAAALQGLSFLYYFGGEYDLAESYATESLALCKELKDKTGITKALGKLGLLARARGDYEQAIKILNQYLTYSEELDNKEEIAFALFSIAELYRSQEEYELAKDYYVRCLKLSWKLGYKSLMVRPLKDMGEIARYQSDFKKARDLYNESLDILMETGDNGELMWVYRNIAELELQLGNNSEAKEFYLKGLKVFRETNQNTTLFILLSFSGLAGVAIAQEQFPRAATLFGAADRLYQVTGKLLAKVDLSQYEQRLTLLKNKMKNEIFEESWNKGRLISPDKILDFAMNTEPDSSNNFLSAKVISYIHENYNRDISLTELSEHFSMSPGYLSYLVKNYTGKQFKDFLSYYRIERAKEILKKSNYKINIVAEMVGCRNVNTFIRMFKRYEGITPGQFLENIARNYKRN